MANPVLTCASFTNSGLPSNFVADPFLYVQVYKSDSFIKRLFLPIDVSVVS